MRSNARNGSDIGSALSEARSAWLKMHNDQRAKFVRFIVEEVYRVVPPCPSSISFAKVREVCHLLALCDEHLEGGIGGSGCVISGLGDLEGGA